MHKKTDKRKENRTKMATYFNRRYPSDTKYIVHPHYANEVDASNEAIGHQVRHRMILFLFLNSSFQTALHLYVNHGVFECVRGVFGI